MVLPQIAKVILVNKLFVESEVEVRQTHLPGRGRERRATCPAKTERFAANQKTMMMKFPPMEGNLEDVMGIGDLAVAADKNPSPDEWVDPPQHEV
jgi:hypothetical protein